MVLAFFFFYKTAEIKSQIAFHCQQGKCLIRIIFFLYNHRSRDKEKNPPKVWLKKVPIGIKIPLLFVWKHYVPNLFRIWVEAEL